MEDILTSGDQEAISAIQQHLLLCHRLLRPVGALSDAPPSPKRELTD